MYGGIGVQNAEIERSEPIFAEQQLVIDGLFEVEKHSFFHDKALRLDRVVRGVILHVLSVDVGVRLHRRKRARLFGYAEDGHELIVELIYGLFERCAHGVDPMQALNIIFHRLGEDAVVHLERNDGDLPVQNALISHLDLVEDMGRVGRIVVEHEDEHPAVLDGVHDRGGVIAVHVARSVPTPHPLGFQHGANVVCYGFRFVLIADKNVHFPFPPLSKIPHSMRV